jgi:hypothetical protein
VYIEITRALQPPISFDKIAKLYQEYGNDPVTLILAKGRENTFAMDRIVSGLKALVQEVKHEEEGTAAAALVVNAQKPVWDKPQTLSPEDLKNDVIKAKRVEIGQLFRECIALRRDLHSVAHTADRRVITLEECFAIMDSVDKHGEPVPFTIWYYTYNDDDHTGGALKKSLATVRFAASPKMHFSKNKTKRQNQK